MQQNKQNFRKKVKQAKKARLFSFRIHDKNQLLHLIGKINPKIIHIVAPVMYKDAQNSLKKEFPDSISSKFEFLTLAVDTVRKTSGEVLPGVGGMVYPKLGLGDITEKNKYTPHLVLERLNSIK